MALDRNQNRKPIYGVVIVFVIILIGVLVLLAPDLYRLAEPAIEVVAVMETPGALADGSPVWIAGREVGVVTRVAFRPANTDSAHRVAVSMRIPRKYTHMVRKDSGVRITSARLIGEPVLDVIPGSLAAPPIHDHDTIYIAATGTLESVMNKTLALTADFDRLILDMQKVSGPAGKRTRQLQQLRTNMAAVSAQFRDFTVAMQHSPMRTLSDPQFNELMRRLSSTNAELRTSLQSALDRAHAAQAQAQPALERLMARSDTITSTIAALRSAMTETGGGLLVRAQKDSAIIKALHEAKTQLDSLMVETKRNPARFWF